MVTSAGDRAARWAAPEHAVAASRLGAVVQGMRTERGFSPQEFAALAAISTVDLAAVEAGDPRVTLATLLTIAEALALDPSQLWERPEAPVGPVPAASASPIRAPEPAAPALPERGYVRRIGTAAGPAAPPVAPTVAPAAARVPRTFADLRVGVLADRAFATLPHFAVAAVTEAGHAVAVVARIFRVPAWRLEGWVRDGVADPPTQRTRQWT